MFMFCFIAVEVDIRIRQYTSIKFVEKEKTLP